MTDLVVKLTEWFDHLDFDRESEATRQAEYSEMLEILAHNPKVTHSGEALVFQLEAVIDRLDGQAYSSTLSALNQFKADLARPGLAATPARDATEAMALAGARSIGNTIHTDNHMVRARECWRAMWDARDGIVEPIPQGTLVSRPEPACPLCRGARYVTYRDGIPQETHDVEKEDHLIEDCPECKGSGLAVSRPMQAPGE